METYSEFRKVVEELISTQNKLAQVEKELETLKAKRESKRRANPDSAFNSVLSSARMRLRAQEGTHEELARKIILKALVKNGMPTIEFFVKFDKAVKRLLALKTFNEECKTFRYSLTPRFVAQHVVLAGEKLVNEVFKNGLENTFHEKLYRMNFAIFSEDELTRYQNDPLSKETIDELAEVSSAE